MNNSTILLTVVSRYNICWLNKRCVFCSVQWNRWITDIVSISEVMLLLYNGGVSDCKSEQWTIGDITNVMCWEHTHTHTLSLSPSLFYTHILSLFLFLSLTHYLSLSHTHTLSLSHSLSLTHSLSHIHTQHTLSHTQTLSLSLFLSLTHIYTHTLSLSYTHTFSLFLYFSTTIKINL